MVKRVYIIAGVIFILVFMVWGLGRIYNGSVVKTKI